MTIGTETEAVGHVTGGKDLIGGGWRGKLGGKGGGDGNEGGKDFFLL